MEESRKAKWKCLNLSVGNNLNYLAVNCGLLSVLWIICSKMGLYCYIIGLRKVSTPPPPSPWWGGVVGWGGVGWEQCIAPIYVIIKELR